MSRAVGAITVGSTNEKEETVSAWTRRIRGGAAAGCAVVWLLTTASGVQAQGPPPQPPGPPPSTPPAPSAPAVPAATPTPAAGTPGTPTPPPPSGTPGPGANEPPSVAANAADFAGDTAVLKRRALRVNLQCLVPGKVSLRRSGRSIATKRFTCAAGSAHPKLRLTRKQAVLVRRAGKARVRLTAGGRSRTATLTVVRRAPTSASTATTVFDPISDVWGCGNLLHEWAGLVHTNTSNTTETFYYSYWRWVHGYGWDWAPLPWQVTTVAPGGVITWAPVTSERWAPHYYYATAAWFYSSVTGEYSMSWLLPRSRDLTAAIYGTYWCFPG
jgi:hypothetical protein